MQPITFLANSPLNSLFLAINHYISTGDHLGEGLAQLADETAGPSTAASGEPRPHDRIRVVIPVSLHNRDDVADWAKFVSRFNELTPRYNTRVENHGREGLFEVHSFVIRYEQCEDLARSLTEQPGVAGWGSMKPLFDRHFPS